MRQVQGDCQYLHVQVTYAAALPRYQRIDNRLVPSPFQIFSARGTDDEFI